MPIGQQEVIPRASGVALTPPNDLQLISLHPWGRLGEERTGRNIFKACSLDANSNFPRDAMRCLE